MMRIDRSGSLGGTRRTLRAVTGRVFILLLLIILTACGGPAPEPTATPTALPIVKPTTTPVPTSATVSGVPGSLTAEVSDTVVKLAWQAVPGAAGYFVYRDGSEKPLFPKPIAETTYADIGLTNGRTYTYTVAAADDSGAPGPQSQPVSATPKSK